MEKEYRILGFDDGPFSKNAGDVLVVGVLWRSLVDAVVSTKIKKDGNDSTKQLVRIIKSSKFKHIHCIMLDGIAFGGFNVVDIHSLYENTNIPVLVVIRNEPDFKKISSALRHLKTGKQKQKLMEKAGKVVKLGKLYCQLAGLDENRAKQLIRFSAINSLLPEPIRLAHMIASGIVKGESKGRA